MTPSEVLVRGAVAIVFVVAWFVFGLIDATRDEARASPRHGPDAGRAQVRGSPLSERRAPGRS